MAAFAASPSPMRRMVYAHTALAAQLSVNIPRALSQKIAIVKLGSSGFTFGAAMKLDDYRMLELLNAEDWQSALRLIAEVNGLPELDYPLNIKFINDVEADDFGISLYYSGAYYDWVADCGGFWSPWFFDIPMGAHGICRLPAGWKQ